MDKRKIYILIVILSMGFLLNYLNIKTNSKVIKSKEMNGESKTSSQSESLQSISSSSNKEEMEKYSFHPQCNCSRSAPKLSNLEKSYDTSVVDGAKSSSNPWTLPDGTYVGHSTCNRYTSAIGSGQKVLSYTYYTPWKSKGGRFRADGRPNDQSSARYAELLQPLATSVQEMYPGWRMRIYHNVTFEDTAVWNKFCNLYCENDHVDFCDARDIPEIGDLNEKFPIGRFWRFQAIGDPTVKIFGSRDVDSWILPRERSAVADWELSGAQFHIMRDGPFHITTILAGLWGAKNYNNFQKALEVRHRLLDVPPDQWKFYDQRILNKRVWPTIRNHATIHDSYNCGKRALMGRMKPWPTKRQGFLYCGSGPTKGYAVKILKGTKCPILCRPKENKNWQYC